MSEEENAELNEIDLKPGQLRIDRYFIFKKSLIKPKSAKPWYIEERSIAKHTPYEFPSTTISLETTSSKLFKNNICIIILK